MRLAGIGERRPLVRHVPDPVDAQDEYMRSFKKLMDLEQLAISLRKRAAGGLTP